MLHAARRRKRWIKRDGRGVGSKKKKKTKVERGWPDGGATIVSGAAGCGVAVTSNREEEWLSLRVVLPLFPLLLSFFLCFTFLSFLFFLLFLSLCSFFYMFFFLSVALSLFGLSSLSKTFLFFLISPVFHSLKLSLQVFSLLTLLCFSSPFQIVLFLKKILLFFFLFFSLSSDHENQIYL
jgi:hypothetical protein